MRNSGRTFTLNINQLFDIICDGDVERAGREARKIATRAKATRTEKRRRLGSKINFWSRIKVGCT